MTTFTSLNLCAPVQSALDSLGYTTPTPIQLQAIPEVMAGRDLMGIAQTGTGKTAGFSLPILDYIVREDKPAPKRGARALILAPTRELASQIAVSVRDYGKNIQDLSVATVFGGVPIHRQIKQLARGNEVLVATPGRLLDLMDRKDIRLNEIEVLVLDEADQMMDMGFIHPLRKIVAALPTDRQTLFFSATMSKAVQKLAKDFLTDPVQVSVTPANTTAEKITQSITFVDKSEKQSLLGLTLLDESINRALVFTRTKHGADRVVKRLASIGLESVAIHGNKSQGQRQRALAAFREGKVRFLIATDIAARGIDIEGISHVINYEIPNVAEQYVHRIGRTARANREGRAISFVSNDEKSYLKDIEKLLKVKLTVDPLPDNFNAKAADLKKRDAIVIEKPKATPRKGRGKGRPKAKKLGDRPNRTRSKDRDKARDRSRDRNETAEGTQSESNQEYSRARKPRKPRSSGRPNSNKGKGYGGKEKGEGQSSADRDRSETRSNSSKGKGYKGKSNSESRSETGRDRSENTSFKKKPPKPSRMRRKARRAAEGHDQSGKNHSGGSKSGTSKPDKSKAASSKPRQQSGSSNRGGSHPPKRRKSKPR